MQLRSIACFCDLSDEVTTAQEWMGGGMIMLAGYLSARAMMKQSKEKYFSTIGQ